MRDALGVRQVSLKSKLLVGAVGLTAAAMSSAAWADGAPAAAPSAAPPSDPPKWLPYAEVGGSFGSSYTSANVDITAPLWQNLDSLFFVQLDAGANLNSNNLYSFGGAYRTKIDPDWILGVYANYDTTQTQYSHSFEQGNLGAELMSADWDVRGNAYLANDDFKGIGNKYSLYIHNTTIAIMQAEETAYSGFDGEVGYRIYNTDTADLRVFVGGFWFNHGSYDASSGGVNFSTAYGNISGEKARAEYTIYDFDALGQQSRLMLQAEIQHDDVRGTTGYVGAQLRIPLHIDDSGAGAQALDELDRRMVDPERRQDNVLTRFEYAKPEPVVVYGSHFRSQPTNTIFYVDNTLGAGSYANPTTLNNATTRPSTNALIVITSKQGAVNGDGVMQAGQTIIGGGETFDVVGTTSHALFTHDFAPGTTNPTVQSATPGDNVITLADTTVLYGFSITGDFGNAVYGHNVNDVTIGKLTINGGYTGGTGIYIRNDTPGTSDIYIYKTSISDVTDDGIGIITELYTTGTINESDVMQGVTVTNAGFEGIHIFSYAGGSPDAFVNQYVGIHNSTVTDSGFDNIRIQGDAGTGGTVTQNFVVDPTTTTGGTYGIAFDADASDGGVVDQYGTVTDFTATGQYKDGVLLDVDSYGGKIVQNIALTNVTATGATGLYGNGVHVLAYAGSGGTVSQTLTATGLTATGNGADGVQIDATVGYFGTDTGSVKQYITITDSTLDGNGRNGFSAYATADGNGAYVKQSLEVTGTDLDGNAKAGAYVQSHAYHYGSINQTALFEDDAFEDNTYDGVRIGAVTKYAGFVYQGATVVDSELLFNGRDGINVNGSAYNGGVTLQNIGIYDDSIGYNGRDGVHINALSSGYYDGKAVYPGSFVSQSITIADSEIGLNARDGVYDSRYARGGEYVTGYPCGVAQSLAGGCAIITQTLGIFDSVVFENGSDGIYVSTTANDLGAVYSVLGRTPGTPTLLLEGDTIVDNGANGVELANTAFDGSYIYQYAVAANSLIASNTGHGIYGHSLGLFGSFVSQNILLTGYGGGHTYVNGNGGDGVLVHSYSYGAYSDFSGMVNRLTVQDSEIAGNGSNGIEMYMFTRSTFLAEQYLNLSRSLIVGNTGYGVRAVAYGIGDYFDAQEVKSFGNVFGGNGSLGMSVLQEDESVNAIQYVSSAHDDFVTNGAGGISVSQLLFHTYYGTQTAIISHDYFTGAGNAVSLSFYAEDVGGYGADNRAVTHQALTYNEFKNIGGDGIDVSVTSNASYVYNSTIIANNHMQYVHGNGIDVSLTAENYNAGPGVAGTIYSDKVFNLQGIEIVDNIVGHTGADGIYVELNSKYDGGILAPSKTGLYGFYIEIDGNSVGDTGGDAIALQLNSLDGFIYANTSIGFYAGNKVTNAGGYGIVVRTSNLYGEVIADNYIDNNHVNHSGLGGIAVNTYSLNGLTGVYSQIDSNVAENSATYAGINIFDRAYRSLFEDTAKIYGNSTGNNAGAGIGLYAFGDGSTHQIDYVGGNTSAHNSVGIFGYAGGASNQYVTVYSLGNNVHSNSIANYEFIDNTTGNQIVH